MVSMLVSLVVSVFIFWAVMYVFVIIYNKKALAQTDKFLSDTMALLPAMFANVKLRYLQTNGGKTQFSPNNYADVYLFQNYLAIVRRQHFVFKAFFPPVLITPDVAITKDPFSYLKTYLPVQVLFNESKGQVSVKLKHPLYRSRKIDLTFKNLDSAQIKQLNVVKDWCRQ